MLSYKLETLLVIGVAVVNVALAGLLVPHQKHGQSYECRVGINGVVCRLGRATPPLDPSLVKIIIRLKSGKDCVQTCRVGANDVWYCDTERGPNDVNSFKIQVPDAEAPSGVVVKRCNFKGNGKWECRSVKPAPTYQCDLRRSLGDISCRVGDDRAANAEVPVTLNLRVSIPNRQVDLPLTCSKKRQHLLCSSKTSDSRPLILMNGLDLTLPTPTGRSRYACSLVRGSLVCLLKPKPPAPEPPLFYEITVPTKAGGSEDIVCKDLGDRLICTHDDLPAKMNVVGGVKCSCDKNGLCSCVSTEIRGNNPAREFDILIPSDHDGSQEWVCVKRKRTTTTSATVRVTTRRPTTKKCCPCEEKL